MKPADTLLLLFLHFMLLSLFAVGGVSATMPEMHRYLVEQQHWISHEQFTSFYAISQAAPGPNVLFVALFGWQIAGGWGVLAAMLGICGPSALFALGFEVFSGRSAPGGWADIVRKGLAPLSIGLLLATGYLLALGGTEITFNWPALALTAISVTLMLLTRWHPLWLISLGAVLGALGWV